MTWGWRIIALLAFLIAMAVVLKIGWALIEAGYYWPIAAFMGLLFIYAYRVDKRNGLPVNRPLELWREHWRR